MADAEPPGRERAAFGIFLDLLQPDIDDVVRPNPSQRTQVLDLAALSDILRFPLLGRGPWNLASQDSACGHGRPGSRRLKGSEVKFKSSS